MTPVPETISPELPVQLRLTDLERDQLADEFLKIRANPYRDYPDFMGTVHDMAKSGRGVPQRLVDLCDRVSASDPREQPFTFLQNCPIDRDVPVFDFEEPVIDKRNRKLTFVAEGFLALFAILRNTPPIGYLNVNDGDVFQDIYPKRTLKDSQSQKALGNIYFHKDLANHFVRPDYVNILSMRADPQNRIYTCFVRNKDALQALDEETREILRKPQFHTPYDDLTVYGGQVTLGEADVHPVLSGELDLRFFENRTRGLNPEAQQAVDVLVKWLHHFKARVLLMPGDFISEHNNFSIHCKVIDSIANEETQRSRWMIKTVNVDRLADHEQHYVQGRYGIVAG